MALLCAKACWASIRSYDQYCFNRETLVVVVEVKPAKYSCNTVNISFTSSFVAFLIYPSVMWVAEFVVDILVVVVVVVVN